MRLNPGHAPDAGFRLCSIRPSLARASDSQRYVLDALAAWN
jgi:hypothetical protein